MQANKSIEETGKTMTMAMAAETVFESFFDNASGVWSLRRVSAKKKTTES